MVPQKITTDHLIRPEYETLIFQFREYKIMVDNDLSKLYGVSTKVLKQQVKRNIGRFPEDFIFEFDSLHQKTNVPRKLIGC